MTPAPITASVRGSSSSCTTSSLEKMQVPSNGVARVTRRLSPDRQHDGGRSDPSLQPAHFVFEKERVRVDKARGRCRQIDAVAQKLVRSTSIS